MKRLTRLLVSSMESARQAYETQLRLQENYLARHDLSGTETVAAARRLRWVGDHLVGTDLPGA